MTPKDTSIPRLQALGFLLLCLAGPVFLPGREQLPPLSFQLRLLPFSLLLGLGLWLCLAPPPAWRRLALPAWPTLLAGALALELLLGLPLHWGLQDRYGSAYAPNWSLLGGGESALLACAALLALRGRAGWRAWAGLGLAGWAFAAACSLAFYPPDLPRSDMLAMLREGGEQLLAGGLAAVYDGQPRAITYLPGLWLSYLPAAALGFDLRLLSGAFVLLAGSLLLRSAAEGRRLLAAALLLAFACNPWLHFRYDCYMPAPLAAAALAAWGLARGRPWVAAAGLAWLGAQSQLAWPALPFLLWHLRLRYGWGRALAAAALAAAALAASLGPFLLWEREAILASVFRVWQGVLDANSVSLAWWLTRLLPLEGLRLLQAGSLAALWLGLAPRLARPAGALAGAGLGLLAFSLLNNLVRDYFFFLPALFLAFALALEEAPLRSFPQAGLEKPRRF